MNNVFVYGTLKRGFSNHGLLKGFDGIEAVASKIDLHAADFSPFPFAQRGNRYTHGEVYSVPDDVFKKLDQLEGHPNFYRREEIWVSLQTNNDSKLSSVKAWIYLCPKRAQQVPRIETGKWDPKLYFKNSF